MKRVSCFSNRKTKNRVDPILARICRRHLPNDCDGFKYGHPTLESDYKDIQKFSKDYVRIPKLNTIIKTFAITLMISVYTSLLLPHCDYVENGVPKFHCTPFEPALHMLNHSGSPGYPFTLKFSKKGDVVRASEYGTFPLWQFVKRRVTGKSTAIFAVAGKHEVKDAEKVETEQLRTFVVGPIDTNICCIMGTRRLYEALALTDGPFEIGMSWEHGGTGRFVAKWPGPVWSADRPKWDGVVTPEVHDACSEFESVFLSEEARIWNEASDGQEYQHYLLMSDGHVAYVEGGEPSGGPKTSFRNSEANWFLFIYFSAKRYVEANGMIPTYDQFLSNTLYACYGDDSVHWATKDWHKYCSPPHLNASILQSGYSCVYDNYEGILTSPQDSIFLSAIPVIVRGQYVPRHVSRAKVICAMVTGCSKRVPDGLRLTWYEFQLTRLYQYATIVFGDQVFWRAMQAIISEYETEIRSTQMLPNIDPYKTALHLTFEECFLLYTDRQFQCLPVVRNLDHPGMSKNIKEAIAVALQPNSRGLRNKGRVTKPHVFPKSQPDIAVMNSSNKKMAKKKDSMVETIPVPAATGSIIHSKRKLVPQKKKFTANQMVTEELVTVIENVSASGTAGAFAYAIDGPVNPGNNLFFPEISSFAAVFEKWRIVKLTAEFLPDVGSGTPGNYAMYFDYDCVDGADTSMGQIISNGDSDMSSVWIGSTISLRDKKGWFWTQAQTTNTGTALDRQQNPCDFRFAIRGCSSNLTIGTIIFRYRIAFKDPKPAATSMVSFQILSGTQWSSSGAGFAQPNKQSFNAIGTSLGDVCNIADSIVTKIATDVSFNLSPGTYACNLTLPFSKTSTVAQVQALLTAGSYGSQNAATVLASSTSTAGSGGTMYINGVFTVSAPGSSAVSNTYYITLTMTVVSPPEIATLGSGGFCTIVSLGHQNDGLLSARLDPGRSYVLPGQLDDAIAYLSALNGCYLICSPSSVTVAEKDDRYKYLELKINEVIAMLSGRVSEIRSSDSLHETKTGNPSFFGFDVNAVRRDLTIMRSNASTQKAITQAKIEEILSPRNELPRVETGLDGLLSDDDSLTAANDSPIVVIQHDI